MVDDISVEDYRVRFYEGGEKHLLLDVRTEEEFEEIRIPGAVNIPLDELEGRIDEVEAHGDLPIVVVCRTGVRSMMGGQILRINGLTNTSILNLATGTRGWAVKQWPVENGAD